MNTAMDLWGCATASEWCQRWSGGRMSWQRASPLDRFDARAYEVHPLSEADAKAYIVSNHYSASYVAASRRFGLWRGGALVGVAVYSIPAQAAVLTGPLPDLEPYRESLELGRLVLDDAEPGNTESWFVARCHDELLATGVRGVVSFADPVPRRVGGQTVMPGHVGFIYQAGNAIYTGRGTPRSLVVLPSGMTLNDRAAQKIRQQQRGHEYAEKLLVTAGARPMRMGEDPARWLADALGDIGATRLRHRGCHRYVFRLGRNQRDRDRIRIGFDAQPYPKTPDR